MESYAVEVRGFSFFYGKKQVLFDVDMNIRRGQVTAVIGPSGCGKSTMLRCINRMNDFILDTRTEGEIIFQNRNITESGTNAVDLRRRVGMVFKSPIHSLNPFIRTLFGVRKPMVLMVITMNSSKRV